MTTTSTTAKIEKLDADTAYIISVVAVNEEGLKSASSTTMSAKTVQVNCAPTDCSDECPGGCNQPNVAAIVIIVVIVVLVIIIGITVTLIILRDKKKKKSQQSTRNQQPSDPVQTERPFNDNAQTVTSPRRE